MIPIKLKLSNFTSYGGHPPELDFTKFKLAAISGPNGAGKSSLLDAITWCIWGTSRAGDLSDALIHSGAEAMQVEFSFELDSHTYTIKRRRSRKGGGSTALELWSNQHNLTEGTIKVTQQKIISTIHLTFETFTNSSFLRQGHADEFTISGPTDRKRILADILGLSHYDQLAEKAKEKAKEAQSKLQLLEYQLLEIDAELSQKDERQKQLLAARQKVSATEEQTKILEKEIKALQKEKETLSLVFEQRTKLEQNLKMQQAELEQIVEQGKQRAERIKKLEESTKIIDDLNKKIDDLKDFKKELDELKQQNQQRLEVDKKLTSYQGKLNLKLQQKQQLKSELDKVKTQLQDLEKEGAKCPTCGQLIGKDERRHVFSKLKSQQLKLGEEISKIKIIDEEDEIKKIEEILSSLKVDSNRLNQLEQSVIQLEDLQIEKEKILQDIASLETEKKTLLELRSLYKTKADRVKQLENEEATLPKISKDLSIILNQLQHKEAILAALRSAENEARSLLGRATELISRAEQLEKLTKQKKEEKAKLQNEKESFEELAQAFGKKGIQTMIIETVIPEIEEEANRLLDRLTEGRMKVKFETQRETKTKLASGEHGLIETLDIIISDEGGERNYELYSGGEAWRVNVAIRLALSKLLTRRAGAKLQFLVIDEGFGTQDAQGRTKIVEVLDAIKNDFEKILVITHLEELKDEFPVRIEVSKNVGGSTFELIGV